MVKPILLSVIMFHFSFVVFSQDIAIVSAEPLETEAEEFKVAIKTRPLNYLIFPLSLGAVWNANLEAEFPITHKMSFSPGLQVLGFDATGFSTIGGGVGTKGYSVSLRTDLRYYPMAEERGEFCEGLYVGPYIKFRAESIEDGTGSYFGLVAIPGLMGGYQIVHKGFVASYLIGAGASFGSTYNGPALLLDFRTGISIGFTI